MLSKLVSSRTETDLIFLFLSPLWNFSYNNIRTAIAGLSMVIEEYTELHGDATYSN